MTANVAVQKPYRHFPLLGFSPGNYVFQCANCGGVFDGDKHSTQCLDCSIGELKLQIATLQDRVKQLQPTAKVGQLWRHKKSGNVYRVDDICIIEETMKDGVLYSPTGQVVFAPFMRPREEFEDGRFEYVGDKP
jgi:hypothetical protein